MGVVIWVKGSSPLLWLKNGRCRTRADQSIDKKIEEEELLVEKRLFLSAPFPENGELSSFFLDTYPYWAESPRGDRWFANGNATFCTALQGWFCNRSQDKIAKVWAKSMAVGKKTIRGRQKVSFRTL